MNSKRSPTGSSFYNSKSEKKEICSIRKMFNKSCRGCVYSDTCEEKEIEYENHRVKL